MAEKNLNIHTLFDVQGRTAVITGSSGYLGRVMASALAQAGVQVAILGTHQEKAQSAARSIQDTGGKALGLACDVMQRADLERCQQHITSAFGPVDILINAAGGNSPSATTSDQQGFFDLDIEAANRVFGLNFTGTFQSCQVFARDMAERKQGCIINITSMSGLRPLTRVSVYSAAKAAIVNFTQWLAVHMAQEYGPEIRVKTLAHI